MQAALGVAQLERFEQIIAKKRWMGAAYTERLKEIPGMQLPVEESWAKQVYWMYGLVLDESRGMDAAEFARCLDELGVQTRPFFLGMHEQPVFWAHGLFKGECYPIAERIAKQGLYLPSGLALTNAQLEETCNAVKRVLL
jgi:perosamine synthetase